ncbi:hypothetical protein QT341_24040 [Escherichia coli]|nr:hypothetical protein [Escherichia coli]
MNKPCAGRPTVPAIMTIGGNGWCCFSHSVGLTIGSALNHIFPAGDIFSNRMVWFEDDQTVPSWADALLAPEQWGMPLPLTQSSKPVIMPSTMVAMATNTEPCDC